jgi:amino acid permease
MISIGPKLSKAGSIASLVCAVHCALTPLALIALPVIAVHSWDGLDGVLGFFWAQTTEWIFVGVIAALAGFGLLATYPRHRDSRPALLTACGLLILIISHLWIESGSSVEVLLDIIGASMIAFAGFWNRRLCHRLGCHTHEHFHQASSPKINPIPDLSSNP